MPSQSVIRGLLACCTSMPLVACTMVAAGPAAPTQTMDDGQQYSLHRGEQVALADRSALRYVRLVNDSRCAPDVQCVWAGDAEVAFEWTPAGGAKQAFSLHTGVEPRQQAIGSHRLALVSLARGAAPEATVRVEPARTP